MTYTISNLFDEPMGNEGNKRWADLYQYAARNPTPFIMGMSFITNKIVKVVVEGAKQLGDLFLKSDAQIGEIYQFAEDYMSNKEGNTLTLDILAKLPTMYRDADLGEEFHVLLTNLISYIVLCYYYGTEPYPNVIGPNIIRLHNHILLASDQGIWGEILLLEMEGGPVFINSN